MIESVKSLAMSKSFWKIQLLNVLWVGRYYFLTCCKVISNLVLISLIFEGLVLASDQKELFLKMILNLFYLLFIFRMIYLGMKFGIKSDGDTLKLILQEVRLLVAMAIFLHFGGLNVETYDSILQGFNQNNFAYLLDNYSRYFFSACLYLVSYKFYYERVFMSAMKVFSFKDNQLTWNASDWLFRFVSPNHVRNDQYFEKDGMMQVQFRLAYSWIMINRFCIMEVIEHCEQETEKLKKPFMV